MGKYLTSPRPKTRRTRHGIEYRLDKRGLPKRTLPGLNHIQSRVQLQEGHWIDLFPLGTSNLDREATDRVVDFIFSLEVAGPLGATFNLRDALLGNFVCAHRMMSTREMVFERLVVQDQVVVQSPPLPLDEPAKRQVLTETLMRSHRARMEEHYYMFRLFGTNNCTSHPFSILDRAMNYGFFQRLGSMLYRLPINPRFYLWVRGLDADPSSRVILAEEFEDYINSTEARQRKEQFLHEMKTRLSASADSNS